MSYIFESYSLDREYRLALKDFSPYIECMDITRPVREVNGLFRFGSIFLSVLDKMQEDEIADGSYRQEISILFHLLANLDFLSGLTRTDLCMLLREEEILTNSYGRQVRKLYEDLSQRQKYVCLAYMELRRQCHAIKGYACEAMRELLDAVMYYSEKKDQLYIWIPHAAEAKSASDSNCTYEQLYELLACLFLDYWLTVQTVWGRHLGIVDFEQTMKTGEFQIL